MIAAGEIGIKPAEYWRLTPVELGIAISAFKNAAKFRKYERADMAMMIRIAENKKGILKISDLVPQEEVRRNYSEQELEERRVIVSAELDEAERKIKEAEEKANVSRD